MFLTWLLTRLLFPMSVILQAHQLSRGRSWTVKCNVYFIFFFFEAIFFLKLLAYERWASPSLRMQNKIYIIVALEYDKIDVVYCIGTGETIKLYLNSVNKTHLLSESRSALLNMGNCCRCVSGWLVLGCLKTNFCHARFAALVKLWKNSNRWQQKMR